MAPPLSFDVVNDFEPISLIADCPMGLFGRATLPPKNLAELIVWLKENPGKAATPCRSGPGLCRDGEGPMGGGAGYVFDRVASLDFTPRFGMALWAPRGTPKEIIAKIDASVIEALADPAAHQRSPGHATNKRQRRSPRSRRAKSRSGGRLSRRPTSGRSSFEVSSLHTAHIPTALGTSCAYRPHFISHSVTG